MFLYKRNLNKTDLGTIENYLNVIDKNQYYGIFTDISEFILDKVCIFNTLFLLQLNKKYVIVVTENDLVDLLDMGYDSRYIILINEDNTINHSNYIDANTVDIGNRIKEIYNEQI